MEDTDKDLKRGALIASRFVLERRLGSGGMGVVWSAVETSVVGSSDPPKVALKFLRGDRPHNERVRQRFLQEAHATRKINHPGVVLIHDVVEDSEGLPVLVMDLLEGETLAARLERGGPMKADEAIRLLLPAVSAIAAAHDQRVIHRDLKPENLFLCHREGERAEIRVLDFGIAKVMRDGDGQRSGMMTSTGVVMGTPFYMAPEQLFSEGEIDERADVWAFGVILYECIAGRRPFVGPSVGQVLRLIALDEYTPLATAAPGAPAASCDLVARLLARERSRRPRTMREVEQQLRSILDGTYEVTLQFAETVEISPAAQTFADRALTPSSGQLRGVERTIQSTSSGESSGSGGTRVDQSTTARVPMASRRGMTLAALGVAILGALVMLRARGTHDGASAEVSDRAATAPAAVLVPSAASATVAEAPREAAASIAAAPAPLASTAPSTRRSATHADAHADARDTKPDAAASAPRAVAAPPTVDSARRPGSVVDVPPF